MGFLSQMKKLLPVSSRSFHRHEDVSEANQQKLLHRLDEISNQIAGLHESQDDIRNRVIWQDGEANYRLERFQYLFWQLYRHEGESEEAAKIRFFHSLTPHGDNLMLMQDAGAALLHHFADICKRTTFCTGLMAELSSELFVMAILSPGTTTSTYTCPRISFSN